MSEEKRESEDCGAKEGGRFCFTRPSGGMPILKMAFFG